MLCAKTITRLSSVALAALSLGALTLRDATARASSTAEESINQLMLRRSDPQAGQRLTFRRYGPWSQTTQDLNQVAKHESNEQGKKAGKRVSGRAFAEKSKTPGTREPGNEFQDCETCPEMVVVPAGSFVMGTPESEKERGDDEGPQHRVTLPGPFAVGKFEVTRDQFAAFVNETDYDAGNSCWTYEKNDWKERTGRSFRDPGISQSGADPAVCLNWNDARAYVDWLSKKTGRTYRLLSEAEWEYAARAGTTSPFSTGQRIAPEQANFDTRRTYNGSRRGPYRNETVEVGSFSPNRFGLHDMHGNVWEWVRDCYVSNYRDAPTDGRPQSSAQFCERRVLRGGAWDYGPWYLRSGNRRRIRPDYRVNSIGFRLATTL